jgi:hypothetical protein
LADFPSFLPVKCRKKRHATATKRTAKSAMDNFFISNRIFVKQSSAANIKNKYFRAATAEI